MLRRRRWSLMICAAVGCLSVTLVTAYFVWAPTPPTVAQRFFSHLETGRIESALQLIAGFDELPMNQQNLQLKLWKQQAQDFQEESVSLSIVDSKQHREEAAILYQLHQPDVPAQYDVIYAVWRNGAWRLDLLNDDECVWFDLDAKPDPIDEWLEGWEHLLTCRCGWRGNVH